MSSDPASVSALSAASHANTQRFTDPELLVDVLLERYGPVFVVGLPLGIGKATTVINALYRRVAADPSLELNIITALSLATPVPKSDLERRFLTPFLEKHYAGVPELLYDKAVRSGTLPDNIQVSEFFLQAAGYLKNEYAQQQYISSNYTHVARDLLAQGVNIMMQYVAVDDTEAPPSYENAVTTGVPQRVSLGCNPDVSLDLLHALKQKKADGQPVCRIGEINRNLPYMLNDALIDSSEFEFILDQPLPHPRLFAAPTAAIEPVDHMIGFHASTLLKDAGTLQIGIGALGSGLVHSSILRHHDNERYLAMAEALGLSANNPLISNAGALEPFRIGLYGSSEMLTDGFVQLMKAGILSRPVYHDQPLQLALNELAKRYPRRAELQQKPSIELLHTLAEMGIIASALCEADVSYLQMIGCLDHSVTLTDGQLALDGQAGVAASLDDKTATVALSRHMNTLRLKGGIRAHGGFFLGPKEFYTALREFPETDRAAISMTSVQFINSLYDHRLGSQQLKIAQRSHARFVNTAMMVTLGGAAISDGLEDGRVVSGVGGQFNFVDMANELPGAHSILLLKSTRISEGELRSNIVFSYGHQTIPRHLRDIFVTEYGIADTRGRSDAEVYAAMISIADSRFQTKLIAQARAAGKLPAGFELDERYRHNLPSRYASAIAEIDRRFGGATFPAFPFDQVFTDIELRLGRALKWLQAHTSSKKGLLHTMFDASTRKGKASADYVEELERMGYGPGWNPGSLLSKAGIQNYAQYRLLVLALRSTSRLP